ncbi:MAG: DUF3795 domain-containing protein [Clostridia bacterium]|nr:DUF3795 domain-containing protein [Clostridia bacterium]
MEKKDILEAIAPCALCCYTCAVKKDGIIAKTANNLLNYHIGYCDFENTILPKNLKKSIREEKKFLEKLNSKSNASCCGCRNGEHGKYCIKNCFILECAQSHGVDFCGECSEFPCNKTKDIFNDIVFEDWLVGNKKIRDVGVEQYYVETIAHSHYLSYSKTKN